MLKPAYLEMTRSINGINLVLPALLGSVAYFLVVGTDVLNPQYLGWLLGRFDPIQHYLG